jgi:predicted transcriptional regulator
MEVAHLGALGITVDIVKAHISQNAVSSADLPGFILEIHRSVIESTAPAPVEVTDASIDAIIAGIAAEKSSEESAPDQESGPDPDAPVSAPEAGHEVARSVRHDVIICLEDGKPFKDLAQHLMQAHNLTPQEYKAKWDLPAEYPMLPPEQIRKRGRLYRVDPATGQEIA